jgi:hypothetical protein
VVIDRDSRECQRLGRELEAGGFHVLTSETPFKGWELVRARKPHAVITADAATDDNHQALVDCLRARIPLIVRCTQPIPAEGVQTGVGRSHVVLVHQSLGSDGLGRLLDGLVKRSGR